MNTKAILPATTMKRNLLTSIAVAITLAALPSARAATYWWDTTSTNLWGTNTNWWTTAAGPTNPAAAPLAADSVVFNGTGVNGATTVQLGAATSITGVTFANTGTTLISSDSTTSNALSIGTGGVTINSGAGAVTIGDATNLAPITLTGAQSWTNNSANLFTVVNAVTNGANLLTIAGTGNTTVSGVIGNGAGGLTKSGAGTLTLTGANTYSGVTSVGGGTLALASSGTITSGSRLSIIGSATFQIQDTAAATFAEIWLGDASSASGNISQTGGVLNYTGTGTGLNSGGASFRIGHWPASTTSTYSLSGGTLNATSGDVAVGWDGNAAFTQSGGTANIKGMGIARNASRTGSYTLTGGTLNIGSNGIYNGPGTYAVNLGGGTVGALAAWSSSLNMTLTGTNGNTTFDTTGGNIALSGALSGAGGFTKSGINTLTLNGTNTYTGKTIVQNGTLSFSVGNATATANQQLGANATLDLGVASTSSGTLLYTGAAGTLAKNINALGNGTDTIQNSGTGLLTLSGTLTKNGTTLKLKGGSNGINVTGSIAGSNANSDLIVDGGNTTLSNANTYNGPTSIINGATLNANVTDALPTSNGRTAVYLDQTVAGAATGTGSSILALGSNQSVSSLSGQATSTVNLNARTLTVGSASGTANFAGIISGANGALIKDNASTQILSGNNTYTGSTLVSAGTLLINGIQSSATGTVSVSSTATLGGSGTTGGAVTVASGGSLAPGSNTIGNLTAASLTLAAGSISNFEIGGTTGGTFDTITTTGGVGSIALNGTLNLIFSVSLANNSPIDLFVGPTANTGDFSSITLAGGGYSGTFNTHVGTLWTSTQGAQTLSFEASTGVLTAVPEPTTWALLAFSLTTVMVLRRRRKF